MQIWQDGDCDYVSSDFRYNEYNIEEEPPAYESISKVEKEIEQEEVSEDSDESILSCIDDEPYTVVTSATVSEIFPGWR